MVVLRLFFAFGAVLDALSYGCRLRIVVFWRQRKISLGRRSIDDPEVVNESSGMSLDLSLGRR